MKTMVNVTDEIWIKMWEFVYPGDECELVRNDYGVTVAIMGEYITCEHSLAELTAAYIGKKDFGIVTY